MKVRASQSSPQTKSPNTIWTAAAIMLSDLLSFNATEETNGVLNF